MCDVSGFVLITELAQEIFMAGESAELTDRPA
jgi:hypothetical protein